MSSRWIPITTVRCSTVSWPPPDRPSPWAADVAATSCGAVRRTIRMCTTVRVAAPDLSHCVWPLGKRHGPSHPRRAARSVAAPTAIPGVVFEGASNGRLFAVSTANGSAIWDFNTAQEFTTVNKVPAHGGAISVSGAVISGGMVFVSSGYAITERSIRRECPARVFDGVKRKKGNEERTPLLSQEGKAREARWGGSEAEAFRGGNHPSHELCSCCPPDSGGQKALPDFNRV